MNSARRDARKASTAERQSEALQLRRAGATYEQIATRLHYSGKSAARKSVHTAIGQIVEAPAKHVLLLELERLDAMLLGIWAKAKNGDVQAIDRCLRIMERRSSYLGLDCPKKSAVIFDAALTLTDGAHAELLGRLAALTAAAERE